jgi:predicted transcriptional regulator
MAKEAVFTMKLDAELRDSFMAEAQAEDRSASQVVRELMREFVQRKNAERAYDEFLERKVEIARTSVRAGRGAPHDVVEARFAARRTKLVR